MARIKPHQRALLFFKPLLVPTTFLDWRLKTAWWWLLCLALSTLNTVLMHKSPRSRELSRTTLNLQLAETVLCLALCLSAFAALPWLRAANHNRVLVQLAGNVAAVVVCVVCWARIVAEKRQGGKLVYLLMVVVPAALGIPPTIAFYVRSRARALAELDIRTDDVAVSDRTSLKATRADGEIGRMYLQQCRQSPPHERHDPEEEQGLEGLEGLDEERRGEEREWPPPYRWDPAEWTSCDDEDLPPGWTMTQKPNGVRVFQHDSDTSLWFRRDPRRRTGWTRDVDVDGRPFYIDHNNRCTTWEKPPLPNLLHDWRDNDIARWWERIWVARLRDYVQVNHGTGVTMSHALDVVPLHKRARGLLPPGWQRVRPSPDGRARYYCHNTLTYSHLDPWAAVVLPLPPGWSRSRWFPDEHSHDAQISFFKVATAQRPDDAPHDPAKDPRLDAFREDEYPVAEEDEWQPTARLSWRNVQSAEALVLYTPYLLTLGVVQTGLNIAATARLARTQAGTPWLLYPPWAVTLSAAAHVLVIEWSFLDRWLITFHLVVATGLVDVLAWTACLAVNAAAMARDMPRCEGADDGGGGGRCGLGEADVRLAVACQRGGVAVACLALPASLFGAYLAVVLVPLAQVRRWWVGAMWDVVDGVRWVFGRGGYVAAGARGVGEDGESEDEEEEGEGDEGEGEGEGEAGDNVYLMETVYR